MHIEKWMIVFEMWLKFSFWDVNCHSKPTFEWWMIKLNEPLMINSPQSNSCFESRLDLPRMQQWCNTSRRQYIVTSHLKNAWNKFVQWLNTFPRISYPSQMGGISSSYSYEYEFLRAGFLGSRIATCKKNAGKRGGREAPPLCWWGVFLACCNYWHQRTSS